MSLIPRYSKDPINIHQPVYVVVLFVPVYRVHAALKVILIADGRTTLDAWPPPTEIGAPPLHVFIVNLMKDVVLHVARCKLYPHGLFLFCHLT